MEKRGKMRSILLKIEVITLMKIRSIFIIILLKLVIIVINIKDLFMKIRSIFINILLNSKCNLL